MRNLLAILAFIFSFVFSFGQPIVPRSNGSLTVQDSNWFAGNSMRVPLFFDTAHANTNRPSLDSMGKIIFTRDVNWFWGRVYIPGTSSHKWVPFANPSTNLNVNCGNSIGSHIVTYDSLLTFDVTGGPYVLCCDGIPRATLPAVVTLAPADSVNPRFDAIVLDSNGVHVIQGTPGVYPTFPQLDSCQILLTYVSVLTRQTVPANITQTVIYDEFVQGEWDSLRTSLVTVDPLNPSFPIHLTVAAYVSNYSGANFFEFHTDTAVDLNNFSAVKFYIRDSSAVRISVSWYLDNQPQTAPVLAPISTANQNTYKTIVMPISNWRFLQNSTLVNTIRFSIVPIAPTDHKGFFIDWIQLQGGIQITNTTTTGIQSFSATGIDAVGTTVINPNGPNTQLVLTKPLQPPFTVYANDSSANAPFRPTAVNLGTPMITGLLDPIHIQPSTTEGDILFTENNGGNLITAWGGGGQDTTFVIRWIRRFSDPNSFNDSLGFGSPFRDSAVINESIFTGLNHFTWTITDTINDLIQFNSSGIKSFNGVLPTSGSGGTDSAIFRNSTTGQWYLAPSGGAGTETLQQVFNTEVGGSVLTKSDTILNNAFTLYLLGNDVATGLSIQNSSAGTGLFIGVNAGFASYAISTGGSITSLVINGSSTGTALFAQSGGGVAVLAESDSGSYSGNFFRSAASTTGVQGVIEMTRQSGGSNAADGYGESFDFNMVTSNGSVFQTANQIISRWPNATEGARSSELDITGVYNAVTDTLEKLNRQESVYTSGTHTFNTDTLFHVVDGNNAPMIIEDPIGGQGLFQISKTNNEIGSLEFDLGGQSGAGDAFVLNISDSVSNQLALGANVKLGYMVVQAAILGSPFNIIKFKLNGSVQFIPITATAASAITPVEGDTVFVSSTNGTFTSIGLWDFENGAWHKL